MLTEAVFGCKLGETEALVMRLVVTGISGAFWDLGEDVPFSVFPGPLGDMVVVGDLGVLVFVVALGPSGTVFPGVPEAVMVGVSAVVVFSSEVTVVGTSVVGPEDSSEVVVVTTALSPEWVEVGPSTEELVIAVPETEDTLTVALALEVPGPVLTGKELLVTGPGG